jgi:hypothetical protein
MHARMGRMHEGMKHGKAAAGKPESGADSGHSHEQPKR